MTSGGLTIDVQAWIESSTGGTVVATDRHLVGASRQAWAVDIERDGEVLELFLLRDIGRRGGSARDAAVLTALSPTEVPVPTVHASDRELGVVLTERIPGRSVFPPDAPDEERDATVRHLMEVTASLHGLDPAALDIAHLGRPQRDDAPTDHAVAQLASVEGVAAMVGDDLHPLFSCTLAWLRRNAPAPTTTTSLVHSDLGPGNLLYRDERIVALLDWEVAHWGDPMEDLAALAVRDMATGVGSLPGCFAEYERHGGALVDVEVVDWYRILILTRNSMLIGLGLSVDDPESDRAQLTMYRSMLMRAAALVLCDVVGVDRPEETPFAEAPVTDELRLVAHAWRDQRDSVEPALPDGVTRQRANGVSGTLGAVDHRLRFGASRAERELDDLAELLGRPPHTVEDGLNDLTVLSDEPAREQELAGFLARHLVREAMLLAPLLGDLADRLPQSLERAR